ncbi:MAG: Rieske 2Fe-2S domain-containing protein, partial [Clostridiales bacterium]|nr:Rieske 2Fe-2S domain-containing protein [Clostridiales bacterium]
RYKNLFKPQRITCVFNFFRNFLCVLKNLVLLPLLPSFKCASKLKSGDGAIVMLGAKKRAVYKDENGNLHVLRAYCPHLKCLLTFNKVDKTWDCPCHGSRFDIDGNIISEPAVNNLKKYK